MSRTSTSLFRITLTAAILGLSILASPQAKADLISNGDFATGNLTGWTPFVTSNGTNGSGLPAVASFNTTGTGASNSARFAVGQRSFESGIEEGGGISQTINVTTPSYYVFRAAVASQDIGGIGNKSAGLFSILIDGTTVGSVNLGSSFGTKRGTLVGGLTLPPGTYTFSVKITRPFISTSTTPNQYVTDISGSPGVPEPSSILLLGSGVLGLAQVIRRKLM